MLKKTDIPGVYKDTKSGALINKDKGRVNAYKKQKQRAREVDNMLSEFKAMKEENEQLKVELKKLKDKVNKISQKV